MHNQLLFGAIASSAMVIGGLMVAPETHALTLTTGTEDFCNTANSLEAVNVVALTAAMTAQKQ